MSRHKRRQVGEGTLIRYRDGVCTFACHHDRCCAYSEPRGWRAGLRQARQHAASHQPTKAGYVVAPEGIPDMELPPTRRRRPLHRLTAAVVVLALAVLAFVFSIPALLGSWTGHAAPRPGPAALSTAILPTTTVPTAAAGPEGYVPTPAGPPATDQSGQWIPEPDQPPPGSSSAGGGR